MKFLENYSTYTLHTNKKGDKYFGDLGSGVLCLSKSTKRFLIMLRSEYVNEPNCWSVVGGALKDNDDDFKTGAIREFEEETGYEEHIELIPLYKFKTSNDSFQYQNYLGLIEDEFEIELDWENQDSKWITFEELLETQPKHFGLELLLKDTKSMEIIKKYANK